MIASIVGPGQADHRAPSLKYRALCILGFCFRRVTLELLLSRCSSARVVGANPSILSSVPTACLLILAPEIIRMTNREIIVYRAEDKMWRPVSPVFSYTELLSPKRLQAGIGYYII